MPLSRSPRAAAGFTLIEILIVVALIAGILAFAANRIFGGQARANVKLAESQLATLAAKVDQFQLDTGNLPSNLDALVRNPGNVGGWLGPYIKEADLKDPWGTPIEIRSPGANGPFELVSLGEDKAPGGESFDADIRRP
jgi:general secretion pathway protein G